MVGLNYSLTLFDSVHRLFPDMVPYTGGNLAGSSLFDATGQTLSNLLDDGTLNATEVLLKESIPPHFYYREGLKVSGAPFKS